MLQTFQNRISSFPNSSFFKINMDHPFNPRIGVSLFFNPVKWTSFTMKGLGCLPLWKNFLCSPISQSFDERVKLQNTCHASPHKPHNEVFLIILLCASLKFNSRRSAFLVGLQHVLFAMSNSFTSKRTQTTVFFYDINTIIMHIMLFFPHHSYNSSHLHLMNHGQAIFTPILISINETINPDLIDEYKIQIKVSL